jgi:hypothetical protein
MDTTNTFPPRPLSADEKKKDLMRLLSDGRSLLDPPPAVGATKPPTSKLADPHSIRPENPAVHPADRAARAIVARVNPAERPAKITHLREHGNVSSWLWESTGTPGELKALPDPMAPSETEVAVPSRETFGWKPGTESTPFVRPERRPVVATARFGRVYSCLSDTRLPNNRGPMFWTGDKGAKPLPGSHREMGDLSSLVVQANSWRLSKQDERQTWAQFLDTGDEDVRQRLVNSCATKCWFHARQLPEQERWDSFLALRDSVGQIVDKREFDPDISTLPTYVDKILKLRVTDIRRRNLRRDRLFAQVDFQETDDREDGGFRDRNRGEAEAVMAASASAVDPLELLLADLTDETDRQIVQLTLDGETQGAIAAQLGVSQQSISKRIKKIAAGGCKTPTAVRISKHGTSDTVPPRLEHVLADAPDSGPLGVVPGQPESLSFVPEAERRTQRPAGIIAPSKILSSLRQSEMVPELFIYPHRPALRRPRKEQR